jgi:hypothetical protein
MRAGCQPVETRRVERVHGGPAVEAVADVAGDARVAGDGDQPATRESLDELRAITAA